MTQIIYDKGCRYTNFYFLRGVGGGVIDTHSLTD